MDLATTLSFILGIVGVTGQFVTARNPVLGWGISIAVQPVWYTFSIVSGSYGLLLLNTGFFAAAIVNFRKARQARLHSTVTPAAQ
jgi:hypothetical protein